MLETPKSLWFESLLRLGQSKGLDNQQGSYKI